ncbi:MAG TPA: hypothetical protein G4N94_10115 [Caldilineae bacterium]|nr:hypothetical protein [Caldilineae bacterium]
MLEKKGTIRMLVVDEWSEWLSAVHQSPECIFTAIDVGARATFALADGASIYPSSKKQYVVAPSCVCLKSRIIAATTYQLTTEKGSQDCTEVSTHAETERIDSNNGSLHDTNVNCQTD